MSQMMWWKQDQLLRDPCSKEKHSKDTIEVLTRDSISQRPSKPASATILTGKHPCSDGENSVFSSDKHSHSLWELTWMFELKSKWVCQLCQLAIMRFLGVTKSQNAFKPCHIFGTTSAHLMSCARLSFSIQFHRHEKMTIVDLFSDPQTFCGG